ncbi:MAG: hypothetical protein AB8H79_10555, partial [Myxococcota bacterium]
YSGFFDADGDEDEVRLSWEVEGRPAFEGAILTSDYFDRGQQIVCVATPHDGIEDGRALRSAPVRVLNSLPEIASITLDNLSPAEGDSITATVNGAADADGDAIHLVYAWSVDGTVVSTDPVLTSTSFNKGDTIELSITPNDGLDDGVAVVSPTATAVNTAPVVHTVTLAPTSPDTDDVLTATVDATDADSDALSFTYEWTVGGSVVGGESGATLSGDVFAKNEVVSVSVVANDGDTDSATVSAASVTVINSPPAFTAVAVDPTTAFEYTVLTCTPSGWSDLDEDAENYDYDWSVNGTSVSTSETLNGSLFNKGDQVVCSATANDLDDTGNTLSSAAVTIDNSLPTLANVRLSDLTPLPGDTLTATAGATTDADGDSVTIEYAWTLDGVDAGTGPTLDLTGATKDAVAVVTATPFDDDGGGTAVTASATIGNTAPTLTSVSLSPSSPGTDEAITATAVSNDFDGDTLTTTYAWTVNSTAVSGATSDTLAASHFAKDDVVQVTVTVDDGDDTTDQTASVTVGNTAPTAPSVSIASVDVEDDEDLICSISTASTDADADSLSYTISWTVDGVNYTGTTLTTTLSGDTIDASATSPNETWACAVVANDGTDDGPEATATADVTYCSIVLTASDSVSVDYDAGTVDDSDEVTIGLDTGYDAVGWYQFDLSSIDDTATIRSAVLSAYETGGGALGSPTVEVAVSDDDGWVPSTLTYGNLEVDGTVSDGGLSSITTAAANEFELDVSAWSYSGDLTDDEVSLGLFSDTSGSLAAFAGPDASGQEPTLTMTLESCD